MHMIYLIIRFLLACYFYFLNYMIFNCSCVKSFIGLLFIQKANFSNMNFSQLHDMNVFIDIILKGHKYNL
ncbi:hypothetical protein C5469_07655 [Photorhabdus cinerea]|uniref:Uncharacterized protein n=1 Tax=Photorhabdus cinerea TaxID=471575 RepID=A0A7X5QD61_9GAMM|nr:hypothetical protein [Photorhabdus cinerea]